MTFICQSNFSNMIDETIQNSPSPVSSTMWSVLFVLIKQCLGSGSAKICGPTDPDPRGKISTKTAKKTFLLSKSKSELLKKKERL